MRKLFVCNYRNNLPSITHTFTSTLIPKSRLLSFSIPTFQPRHLKLIRDKRSLSPLITTLLKRSQSHHRQTQLNSSQLTSKSLADYREGFDISSYGDYQVLVPKHLKLGVPDINIDTIVPLDIVRPPYAYTKDPGTWVKDIPIKSTETILKMRKVGKLASEVLKLGGSLCKPGVTTEYIDLMMREAIIQAQSYPSTLNYMGFPASICTSINNVICHGIPDKRALRDGDIINIDVTVYLDGFHGDTSATYLVGNQVDDMGRALVYHTKRALELGISVCGPNVPFSEIGNVISEYAHQHGYSVSEEFTGHGIGSHFHENPLIFHHKNDEPGIMVPGMTFTIEPMLCQGTANGTIWPDGWTIVTEDGGRSAQFEHTILVTDTGVEILTQ